MFLIHLIALCLSISICAADAPQSTSSILKEAVYTTSKPETKEEPQTTRLKEILEQAAELLQKQESKTVAAPSGAALSGITVNLLGKDATEPLACPIEFVKHYFGTLQEIIEDLGATDVTIPLHQVTNNTCACLIELVKILYANNNEPIALKQSFSSIIDKYGVAYADLLNAANYLAFTVQVNDATVNMVPELAVLYTTILKTRAFDNTKDADEDIGEADIKLFTPSWLLHELLQLNAPQLPPAIKRTRCTYNASARYSVTLSNSGTQDHFACLWAIPDPETLMPEQQYVYIDLSKPENFPITIQDPSVAFKIGRQCALSNDGKYLAIIGSHAEELEKKSVVLIYNTRDNSLVRKLMLQHPINDLITLLFNDESKMFDILITNSEFIILDETTQSNTKIFYYSLDPTSNLYTKKSHDRKKISKDILLGEAHWSCINGSVIGINPDGRIILSDNKVLYEPSTKTHSKDFGIISILNDYRTTRFLVQQSFIPDFDKIMSQKLNITNAFSQVVATQFDPNHLQVNFVQITGQKSCIVGIYYPCDPRLLAAVNWLNKEVINNGKRNILKDAYFLYQFHANPITWQTWCAAIWKDISPTIKKIYGLENYTPSMTTESAIKPVKQSERIS